MWHGSRVGQLFTFVTWEAAIAWVFVLEHCFKLILLKAFFLSFLQVRNDTIFDGSSKYQSSSQFEFAKISILLGSVMLSLYNKFCFQQQEVSASFYLFSIVLSFWTVLPRWLPKAAIGIGCWCSGWTITGQVINIFDLFIVIRSSRNHALPT